MVQDTHKRGYTVMHDLKALRENPAAFDKNWARRGLDAQTPAILQLDESRRKLQTELQAAQNRRNEASKEIGQVKSKGGDAAAGKAGKARLDQHRASGLAGIAAVAGAFGFRHAGPSSGGAGDARAPWLGQLAVKRVGSGWPSGRITGVRFASWIAR